MHQVIRECSPDVMIDANTFAFYPQRLTRQYPAELRPPHAGELHLWRFRYGWLPVTVQKGESWLSESERERARLGPNAALLKRFIAGRVVLRWIASNLLDMDPRDVQLVDGQATHPGIRFLTDSEPLCADIAYGGIWIVIGVASTALGIGITMPIPGVTAVLPEGARSSVWTMTMPDHVTEARRHAGHSQQQARLHSLLGASKDLPADVAQCSLSSVASARFVTVEATQRWHVIDVPMPGEIRAAVSVAQSVTEIRAFGWKKI
ncbi:MULTISPECIES: hypothetical protein [Burkholderia]|uniref:hypothetical protein n=1 Tax=Burkholderia TaxID=32008 RepID=UPI0012E3BF2E|nr:MULTISPECIES: hypothetical protein [Burkholderia]